MINRRKFITMAAGVSLSPAAIIASRKAEAADAEFTYKFATTVSTEDPVSIYAQKVADRVREATNGRMLIQVFPSGQLGNDTALMSSIRSGSVEFTNASDNVWSNLTPVSALSAVGFAFNDYETAWKALDGDVGVIVRREIAKFGATFMDKVWDSGLRQVYTSSKPINSASDFAGMKIRVPVTPIVFSMFKDMGAAPVSINFNEVYTALQTRLVDGMETAPVAFMNAKLFEVQKNCSLTNHYWSGYWIAANTAALNRLPANLQEIVRRVINDTADEQRQHNKRLNLSAIDDMRKSGMTIITPSDRESFRVALQKSGYYKTWEQKFGNEAWAALQKYSGKLG